jgi:fibronectin type 3 domain-containing protein
MHKNSTDVDTAGTGAYKLKVYIEPGGDFSTAIDIDEEQELAGEIKNKGQEIYYKFTPKSTGSYTIESSGSTDVRGYLYNSSKSQILYDYDGGKGKNFYIAYTMSAGEEYYIKVQHQNSSGTGDYSLKISKMPDDYANNFSGAANILLDVETEGMISYACDKDGFKFTPSESGIYIFESYGNTDTKGVLYRAYSNGNTYEITSNDDADPSNNNFFISAKLDSGITYYISVSHKNDSDVDTAGLGAYSLKLYKGIDMEGDNFDTASQLALEKNVDCRIDYSGDYDYFKFTPAVSGEYTIESAGYSNLTGILYNGSKENLSSNSNGADSRNFRIVYNLTAGQTYYLRVYGNGSGSGQYKIRVFPGLDDYKDTISGAAQSNIGVEISGRINYGGDVDFFRIVPDEDGVYTIKSTGITPTYGEIFDNNGRKLAFSSNDGNDGVNFSINQSLLKSNPYYIKVSHADGLSGIGNYGLIISKTGIQVEDDYGNSFDTAEKTSLAVSLNGKINYSGDKDFFWFVPDRDGMYIIESSGTADVQGYLYNGMQNCINYDDNSGIGSNFMMATPLKEGQKYYLSIISSKSSDSNDYSFKVYFVDDDYANTIDLAESISIDSEKAGKIDYKCDIDVFKFTVDKNGPYFAESFGDTDTYAELYNSSNQKIYSNDNGSDASRNFQMHLTLDAGQTYYLKVMHQNHIDSDGAGVGSYSVRISEGVDDHGNEFENASEIQSGSITGELESIWDKDVFKFTPNTDGMYVIKSTGATDVYGYLYDSLHSDPIALNDNSSDGKNFLISYLMEAGKVYYIKVSHSQSFGKGKYGIVVQNDIYPPVILGIEPADNSVLGANPNIIVRAEDNVSVSKIKLQYSLDGSAWSDIETKDTSGTALFNWKTNSLNGKVYIRAIAYDDSGNASDGTPVRTYTLDSIGPNMVTGLSFTPHTTYIVLKWNNVPDDDVAYFVVERKRDNGSYEVVGETSTTLGMNLTGLKPKTSYTYRVTAYDRYGNPGKPSEDIETETLPDTTPPWITAIGPSPNSYGKSIPLWASASDNANVASIKFQMSRDFENWSDISEVSNTNYTESFTASCNFDVSSLEEGKIYIRAVARDGAGLSSNETGNFSYAEYMIDRTGPARPENVTVEASAGYITLRWEQGNDSDLKYYRVYKKDNATGEYILLKDNISSLGYIDRSVELGTTYSYMVSAVDIAGNEGEKSDVVSAKPTEDNEKPEILSISPSDGSTLPANPTIAILAADSYRLGNVQVFLKAFDAPDSEWKNVYKKDISSNSEVVTFSLDTNGLSEGKYIIKAVVEDASGNISIPKTVTYELNLLPPAKPVVKGVGGGWKAELSWDQNQEKDFAGYRVYRSNVSGAQYQLVKETTKNTFTDTGLTPGKSYYYTVEALDIYRNAIRSDEITVIPTDEDLVNPIASAGDDLIVSTGETVLFDGTSSKDNNKILDFYWDFGDGTVSNLAQPSHIYSKPGIYTVTLTVKDPAGNIGTDTLIVTVKEPQEVGTLEIRVLDDSSGVPITGANVAVEHLDGTIGKYRTNEAGIVKVSVPHGNYNLYAYKDEYKTAYTVANVAANSKTSTTIKLTRGQIVVGELNVRRLTFDEILDAGIDIKAPENQWVYKFEVHLAFQNRPLPKQEFIVNGYGSIIIYEPLLIGDDYIAYPAAIPVPNHPEVRPTIAYLVIPGEAKFLKEFFEVSMLLENTASPEFVIEQSKAVLKLPDGLALASTKEPQSLEVNIGNFTGGENKEIKWIIRGDKEGLYTLEADFTGVLQPFGDTIKATFKNREPIKVWGDDALKMHVISQDRADKGHPYYVRIELENVSDIPVYYPSIELLENGRQNYFYAPNQELEKVVKELPAGQKLIKEYTLVSAIDGELDLSKSFILKTGGNGTIQSDIQKISVPQNYKGYAPVLKEVQNDDGTVTLTWEAVQNALGYKIYSVRKDLIMSKDPDDLIAQVDASVNTYTINEAGIEKDYIITTLLPEGEIMRHAIKWPYGEDPAPAIVTVDPSQVYTKTETEILITANQNGYPVDGGTVDVVNYSTGTVLDSNGQAKVKINPDVPGDITINVYSKDHQWLVSTKITAVDKPVQLITKGYIDSPKKDQVITDDKYTISGWFLDPRGVAKIEVLIDDVVVGEATYGLSRPDVMNVYPAYNNNNSGFSYVLDLKNVSQGTHSIKIRETGNDGKQTTLPVKTFERKLKARGVLDSVKDNQTISGKYNVWGWILDGSGVAKVEVLVDGVVVGEATYGKPRADVYKVYPEYNNENSGFSFILNAMAFSEGTHRITIRETGNDGSQLVLPECTVNISHELPTIGFLDKPKDNMIIGGRYNISGWFLDQSGVAKIEVLVDDVVVGEVTYGYSRPDVFIAYPDYNNEKSGYMYLLDTTQLSEGEHTITVRETGTDGNTTTLRAYTVTVSRSYQLLPIGCIDSPKADATVSGKVKVLGWALDKAGVSKIEILVDSQVVGEAVYGDLRKDVMEIYPDYENDNSGFHYILDTTLLSDGKHTITLRETDSNNNQNDLKSVEINVLNATK